MNWTNEALDAALGRIDEFVNARLARDTGPGISLALTTRDELIAVATTGLADVAAGIPVKPSHLFEFGSIGKSFTAVALLQLRDEGRLDLDTPVSDLLPLFAIQSEYAPITVHHLLTHSSGLSGGNDFTPDPRFEVWATRELQAAHAPGEGFHYSNLGYKALGLLLERLEGKPYAEVIRERLLDPLGMHDTVPVIDNNVRPRLAVGYVARDGDRPWHPRDPLAPATWLESNTGDGCICSTASDLTIWLRMLMNGGVGPAGRVLSEESFALLTERVIEMGKGSGLWYGCGLYTDTREGMEILGHTGGMVGYESAMFADVERGIGAVVLVNGTGMQQRIVRYAISVLAAAQDGTDLPPLPDEPDLDAVENADSIAGTYRSDLLTWEIVASGDRLSLVTEGRRVPLTKLGATSFRAADPELAWTWLQVRFDGENAVALVHGGDVLYRDGVERPSYDPLPEEWHAYTGHYRSHNPWTSDVRVVACEGQLQLLFTYAAPDGFDEEQALVPQGDGLFGIPINGHIYDWIRFDTIVDGEALRATISGGDYYRFFTP
ncbi:MAG: beta-lactamase family protein [Thermomicrobiales bacterium]|nr:beta-lactamase family protein [Thermomicrobiales bacterium]